MTDEERYEAAMHAVLTGVGYVMEREKGLRSSDTSLKQLRAGINSSMVDSAAMARLLMEKGVITDVEYRKALADEAEREVHRYEALLKAEFGVDIQLL